MGEIIHVNSPEKLAWVDFTFSGKPFQAAEQDGGIALRPVFGEGDEPVMFVSPDIVAEMAIEGRKAIEEAKETTGE